MAERSYLQWVGTSHYPTIEAFLDEAKELGICKRLPNLGLAAEVAKPGTVIFMVHDRGRARPCPACAITVVCPTCRGSILVQGHDCARCCGLGSVEESTGGYAEVDGGRWSYLRWLRLRKTPGHPFWKDEHTVGQVKPCKACGGRGRIPLGAVFGLYVPRVICVGGASALGVPRSVEACGFEYVPWHKAKRWPKRGAGKVVPGLYAVADYKEQGDVIGAATQAVHDLELSQGMRLCCDVALLDEPLPYRNKQFRGLKRWRPDLEGG